MVPAALCRKPRGVAREAGAAPFGVMRNCAGFCRWIQDHAIASTVIGGATLSGGRGKPAIVMFGAMVISIINNFMTLQGIGSYYQKVVLGIIIIVSVFFSESMNRKR